MPDIYELSMIYRPVSGAPLRESITCDREIAVIWLREKADELELNYTDVTTSIEPPEQAACRQRSDDEPSD